VRGRLGIMGIMGRIFATFRICARARIGGEGETPSCAVVGKYPPYAPLSNQPSVFTPFIPSNHPPFIFPSKKLSSLTSLIKSNEKLQVVE
ncbi:hypothetical protein, partial [Paracoccus siganidrum]|uniref:hypothetical protein n=1 Tax=Paracoccus siganidrum TaxID=1276757 RepID=UPI00197D3C3A